MPNVSAVHPCLQGIDEQAIPDSRPESAGAASRHAAINVIDNDDLSVVARNGRISFLRKIIKSADYFFG